MGTKLEKRMPKNVVGNDVSVRVPPMRKRVQGQPRWRGVLFEKTPNWREKLAFVIVTNHVHRGETPCLQKSHKQPKVRGKIEPEGQAKKRL